MPPRFIVTVFSSCSLSVVPVPVIADFVADSPADVTGSNASPATSEAEVCLATYCAGVIAGSYCLNGSLNGDADAALGTVDFEAPVKPPKFEVLTPEAKKLVELASIGAKPPVELTQKEIETIAETNAIPYKTNGIPLLYDDLIRELNAKAGAPNGPVDTEASGASAGVSSERQGVPASGSIMKEIQTYLGGVAEAPVQALAQGLGSIVPYVGTGVIGGIAKLGGPTVRAINTVVGAAQGAGTIKGSIYDNVKDELVANGMSEKEAKEKASKAQEYLGSNFLDIAGGALLGAAGARVGVESMLTPGAVANLDKRLLTRMGKAALAEAPLEGAQGGQEQLAINRALQKILKRLKDIELAVILILSQQNNFLQCYAILMLILWKLLPLKKNCLIAPELKTIHNHVKFLEAVYHNYLKQAVAWILFLLEICSAQLAVAL